MPDPCGVYEGPDWVPWAVTVEATRGWAVTMRGGTTVGALDDGREAAVVSLASLSGEAGRVAVALAVRRPPDPAMGDVSGG